MRVITVAGIILGVIREGSRRRLPSLYCKVICLHELQPGDFAVIDLEQLGRCLEDSDLLWMRPKHEDIFLSVIPVNVVSEEVEGDLVVAARHSILLAAGICYA